MTPCAPADSRWSSTDSSMRVRAGTRLGWVRAAIADERCTRSPGCGATRRALGIVRSIAPGGSSTIPSHQRAVPWLSAAPAPAYSSPAHATDRRETGPVWGR